MKKKDAQISAKLSEIPIEEISHLTGFVIRENALITGLPFVLGFFTMMLNGTNTVLNWSQQICILTGHSISAQALQGKLQFRHQQFMECLLGWALRHQIKNSQSVELNAELFKKFGQVYVEDSTCVSLPATLAKFFPGSFSKTGEAATARIQLRIELKSGDYAHMELQSFRDNDQKFSSNIVKQARAGDLVIRDKGYFSLPVFKVLDLKGVFFLSRFKNGTNVYDAESKELTDLAKELRSLRNKGGRILDKSIILGKEAQFPVRLVAIKVPPQVEQQRKRKADKNRDKRVKYTDETRELMGWTIFITNVDTQTWSPQQMLEAYGLRWRIETIFKCWKSDFDFAHLFDNKQSMTPARAVMTFYLLLIWLTLFFARWYHFFLYAVFKENQRCLSLSKFASFVKQHFEELILSNDITEFLPLIARYCILDKRKHHSNYLERLNMLKLP